MSPSTHDVDICSRPQGTVARARPNPGPARPMGEKCRANGRPHRRSSKGSKTDHPRKINRSPLFTGFSGANIGTTPDARATL